MHTKYSFKIRNMVCDRCVSSVKHILNNLEISDARVRLGAVEFESDHEFSVDSFNSKLRDDGFEIIFDSDSKLVEAIKIFVINEVRKADYSEPDRWSDVISSQFKKDYTSISRIFSEISGITLERYIILQKIELIKEWLRYDELTVSEMAWKLGYSSSQHLSSQFKANTGMSPTQFKNNVSISRKGIDQI